MTRLLLDFPWALEAGLGPDKVPQRVILAFLNRLTRSKLNAVPFIEHDECNEFWNSISGRKGRGRFRPVLQFLYHCTRNAGGLCRATPVPEPSNLRESWKRALRDEMIDPANWRNPQIVVPSVRCTDWPLGHEVDLNCEQCGDEPASGQHQRVLAILEKYESHPFAIQDLDPWRHLESLWQSEHGARNNNPCWLPKPPILEGVSLEDLADGLKEARRQGWEVNGRYYFIPRDDFRAEQISKEDWRNGKVFKHGKKKGWKGPKLVDYEDRIWCWDLGERHWDVQLEPHMSISHDGHCLHVQR